MSEPILPLRQWPAGIQQASVPANDNALRLEALSRPALGVSNNAAGGESDGDVWIVGDTPTGVFSAFEQDDIALYHVDPVSSAGGWQGWAPVDGLRVVVNDVRKVYTGTSGWIDDPSISGGGGAGVVETIVPGDGINVDSSDPANPVVSATGGFAPIVTESGTSLNADDTNSGNYTRFTNAGAKTYTFDDAETYSAGDEYHGRNVGAGDLTITESGTMAVSPPSGGTLVIPQGGTFTVKIVSSSQADLFGVTVQSS